MFWTTSANKSNFFVLLPYFRACLNEGGGPQIGKVTPLGGVQK